MSFLLGAALLAGCGSAWLRLLDLAHRHAAADLALGWFVGTGWYALACAAAVLGLGLPSGLPLSLTVLGLPVLALGLRRGRPLQRLGAPPSAAPAPRYRPRPLAAHGVLAAVALATLALCVLHGKNTPTQTDDAVRLRAYTPVLVWRGETRGAAREAIVRNGILPSFVPLLPWQLRGGVLHFHVNYGVLAHALAFAALVFLAAALRGRPERGVAGVFLAFALPLFAYHVTSTYADVLYAIPFAAGLLYLGDYAQGDDPRDAGRAALLFTAVCTSKAEGEIAGLSALAVLGLCAATRWRRGGAAGAPGVPLFVLPALLYGAGKVALLLSQPGGSGLLGEIVAIATGAGEGAAGDPARGARTAAAARGFAASLFSSGNFALVFYLLLASALVHARRLFASPLRWPLLLLGVALVQNAVSGILLFPQWTLDQSTVHRSNLALALGTSLLLADLWFRRDSPQTNLSHRRDSPQTNLSHRRDSPQTNLSRAAAPPAAP